MSKKPVVYFKDLIMLKEGVGAVLRPLNHPNSSQVSNKRPVYTSKVVRILDGTSFETENTIYKKQLVE